ncbi:MAG: NUDIX domain-containing protein [Eubacterium sp.]|nr:NUDIX domain-containing protein [Eubacterium sp.]
MDGKLRNMTSLYLISGDRMLLLYRVGSRVVNNVYTGAAGGHFEKDELNDARACAIRELYEETGLTENDIENLFMRYITLRLKNGEVRQNYYFFADLKNPDTQINSDEGELKWFSFDELDGVEMPFSAKYVIEHYLETGRYTDILYGGMAERDGIDFKELKEF